MPAGKPRQGQHGWPCDECGMNILRHWCEQCREIHEFGHKQNHTWVTVTGEWIPGCPLAPPCQDPDTVDDDDGE